MSAAAIRLHTEDCVCSRCLGAQPGNGLALKHGSYADPSRFTGRVVELADAYREHLPVWSPADEPVLKLFAVTMVRVERASAVLADLDEKAPSHDLTEFWAPDSERFSRLRSDLRSWISLAAKLADQLGMSPTSRARLGVDLLRVEDGLAQLAATGAEIRERREAA